jgi:alpha-tubulin suppressor-like RCC1 family protein
MVAGLGDPKQIESEPGNVAGDDGGIDADADAGVEGGEPGPGAPVQAVSIAMSATHGCAVVIDAANSPENGTIRCWGSNRSGELGNDPAAVATSSTPLEVAGRGTGEQTGASTLALATAYSCTVTNATGGSFLLCWGNVPGVSRVTREEATPAYEPSYMDIDVRPLAGVASASMTDEGGCCTLNDQSLVCWGQDLAPPAPDGGVTSLDGGLAVGDEFDTVAVGRAHACGIAATSSSATRDVECWGANDRGQAGLPLSTLVSHPNHMGLGTLGNLRAVATGGDVSCALFESGALYCWGQNDHGQLGTGTSGADSPQPQQVMFPAKSADAALPKATAVAVGDGHACAVLDDFSVWCWGDNGASQLGGGQGGPQYSAVPGRVQKAPGHYLGAVQGIAAGGQTTCAILIDDTRVWCWGANDSLQAGQPVGNEISYAAPVEW